MKRIFLLLFFVCFNYANAQGLKFSSSDELQNISKPQENQFGFAEEIPSRYSMEEFVPMVLEQQGGTCVGFSSTYYALSTMYNVKFKINSFKGKVAHSFDPYFIYTIMQNNVDNCDDGLVFYEAMELLKNAGAKKMFYPPFLTCNSTWTRDEISNTLPYKKPYSLKEFYNLDLEKDNIVKFAKEMIYYDIPVVGGFNITKSLYPYSSNNLSGVKASGLWTPSEIEGSEGGHAMCIIGYDDYKYGGAFRVVNSWGSEYGDNGYIWMRYSDFEKYAVEAYVFELNENLDLPNEDKFELKDDDYSRIKLGASVGAYEGQEYLERLTGYGIFSSKKDDTYYMGKFTNAEMEGYFLFLDDDGLFSSKVIGGKFYEINQLGFANNDESNKNDSNLRKYLEAINSKVELRKATSTKTNKISTKIN